MRKRLSDAQTKEEGGVGFPSDEIITHLYLCPGGMIRQIGHRIKIWQRFRDIEGWNRACCMSCLLSAQVEDMMDYSNSPM